MAAVLALLASVLWGSSDFGGGLLSRRHPVTIVIVVSQSAALVVALCVAVVVASTGHGEWSAATLSWGAASGLAGMVGLFCFYTALSSGAMGVVAPIASLGVVVPLVAGLMRGEKPSGWQAAGIAIATVGVLLVARAPASSTRDVTLTASHRRAVGLAVAAAVGFGFAVLTIAEGSGGRDEGRFGDIVTTLLAQRGVNVVIAIGAVVLVRRQLVGQAPGRSTMPALIAVGVVDLTANGLYGYASLHGLVSVVSVLASLYPVVTVLLARQLLRERLAASQLAGVGSTLIGVVLLGAG
jgi:drug/metabolite transporter (DMT)-like permease